MVLVERPEANESRDQSSPMTEITNSPRQRTLIGLFSQFLGSINEPLDEQPSFGVPKMSSERIIIQNRRKCRPGQHDTPPCPAAEIRDGLGLFPEI